MNPFLLVVVVCLTVITDLVNRLVSFSEILWHLYARLPTKSGHNVTKQCRIQKDVLKIRQEMAGTSSQDEFAKWAKLRRKHDKKIAELEKIASSISTARASFDAATKSLRWLVISGSGMILQYWYRKEAMFWLPQGWFPGYMEWLLSFPKAPLGSISINVWSLCCVMVISTISNQIVQVLKPSIVPSGPVQAGSTEKTVPIK